MGQKFLILVQGNGIEELMKTVWFIEYLWTVELLEETLLDNMLF